MAEQSFANHTKFDPPLHFFIVPVLLLNVIVTAGVAVHRWPEHRLLHLWLVVVSLALLMLAPVTRLASLRAQDRIIRLEERLRYQQLLGPEDAAAAGGLTLRQLLALRFASDEELAGLVRRALAEELTPKAIKQAIKMWRPDLDRV